jgi:flavin reductase (DIM6/NTAB) family NADH-FMN oxidoreductase RutF
MDPPLVLVCIANSAASRADFTSANGFGISIPSQQQVDISVTFATAGANKFDRVRWMRSGGDNPIIEAGVAWLDCAKHEMISAGDHSILLGRVLDFGHSSEAPLGFYQGRYMSLLGGT